jgi:phosphonate ABC transporter permease subunit PhnE
MDAEAISMKPAAPRVSVPAGASLRRWQRFTTAERVMRSGFYIIVIIAIVWSLQSIEIIPEFLYDAPQQSVDLFARMWPIDWSWYGKVVHAALIETLHTATLGTIVAVAAASLVALLVARNITHSVVLNTIGRFILVATRSVHAMVWALFFTAVFGPGALAGTAAIAVHSIGFTGKLLSEAIEEARPGPIEALIATGASPLAILIKGYWPQIKPAFLAIAVFRWDINVRESAVLGLVGGGGLGMALDTALSNLYWDQVGLVLFVIFLVVIVTEIITAWIRNRII